MVLRPVPVDIHDAIYGQSFRSVSFTKTFGEGMFRKNALLHFVTRQLRFDACSKMGEALLALASPVDPAFMTYFHACYDALHRHS